MNEKIVAAIGNFDGVHIGHDKIIKKCIDIGNKKNIPKYIITFEYNDNFFKNFDKKARKIYGDVGKKKMLNYYNIDGIISVVLTKEISNMEPEDFVKKILIDTYKIDHIVAGYNFHFGYKAKGDINLLRTLGEKYKFGVKIIDEVLYRNKDVSSTSIRKLIENGKIDKANKLLINNYTIFLKEHEILHRKEKEILIKKGDFAYPKVGTYRIQEDNYVRIEYENGEICFCFNDRFDNGEIIFKN
ncbi:MAG: FAD synthetase family protein [Bacillota bacterium]|nr:FAD synthetase family protein [Bacillota bacterium]